MSYDPSIDRDDRLPEGPPKETFSEKLRRLAKAIHGTSDVVKKETPEERAHRVRTEPPFGDRLDQIFRHGDREPGEEG